MVPVYSYVHTVICKLNHNILIEHRNSFMYDILKFRSVSELQRFGPLLGKKKVPFYDNTNHISMIILYFMHY